MGVPGFFTHANARRERVRHRERVGRVPRPHGPHTPHGRASVQIEVTHPVEELVPGWLIGREATRAVHGLGRDEDHGPRIDMPCESKALELGDVASQGKRASGRDALAEVLRVSRPPRDRGDASVVEVDARLEESIPSPIENS